MSILTLNIRNAAPQEAEQLVQLHYSAVHHRPKAHYPRHILDSWAPPPDENRCAWMRGQIETGHHSVIVAEEQSGVISGYCMFSNADGVISGLYVLPERAGNGIGRLLLKRAEGIIAERDCAGIKVHVPENAVSFYQFAGYEVLKAVQQKLPDGTHMDCHEMFKNLAVKHVEGESPAATVRAWVEVFNRADVAALVDFYSDDAVNHQVAEAPVVGKAAIGEMFAREFEAATMVCNIEHIFEDGEWAILEWKDPLGIRGCGFFHVIDGKIIYQRGYWDKLTFLRKHGLPLPAE